MDHVFDSSLGTRKPEEEPVEVHEDGESAAFDDVHTDFPYSLVSSHDSEDGHVSQPINQTRLRDRELVKAHQVVSDVVPVNS